MPGPIPALFSTLVLTDDFRRGARLVKSLSAFASCTLVDLLEPENGICGSGFNSVQAIVSDVSFAMSSTIGALRRQLDRFHDTRPPYFCLLQENDARSRAQAQALGPIRTLPASRAIQLLPRAMSMAGIAPAGARESLSIDRKVALANAALIRLFHAAGSGGSVTTKALSTAGELVAIALSSGGIRAWLDVVWQFDNATHQHCLLVAGLGQPPLKWSALWYGF